MADTLTPADGASRSNTEAAATPLVFALDFDDTFTADPALWSMWISIAKSRGHQVYCVTARRDTMENRETVSRFFRDHGVAIPTVFTNLASKVWTMEKRGIKVNVWIDD